MQVVSHPTLKYEHDRNHDGLWILICPKGDLTRLDSVCIDRDYQIHAGDVAAPQLVIGENNKLQCG
jgi:hypothetical protein